MACLHGDLASRIDHFAESLKQAAPRAGRTRRTSRKADGPADTGDVVEFGVSHPDTCRIGVPFLIDVWVFRLGEREAVAGLAEKGAGEPVRFRAAGSAVVPGGTALTISVDIGPWQVEPASQRVVWAGSVVNASFRVLPTEPLPDGKASRCRVKVGGLSIGQVLFEVRQGGDQERTALARGTAIRSAFASYASKDRRRVLARVQGIEKLGVRVFMDVRDLKSGSEYPVELLEQIDRSDRLFLFWSRHARNSEWVQREWRYGLEQHGIGFVDPLPLVDPRKVPPPPELGDVKHFGDWTLAYREYENASSLWNRLRGWIAGE
jgi:hypothetical protein